MKSCFLETNWIIVRHLSDLKNLLDPWEVSGSLRTLYLCSMETLQDPWGTSGDPGSFQTLMQGDRWGHPFLGQPKNFFGNLGDGCNS